MADRDQHSSREDEIRRAVFDQVDLQTAELEIVGSIYDGFAAAIVVTGQPRTVALTREYSDAVQLMALIERGRSAPPAPSEASAAAGEDPEPVRGEIRVIDGNRCRFIERELEGDKWEIIGPANTGPAASPEGCAEAQPVAVLRPVVLAFAHLMVAKLQANDWKPGWKKDSPLVLLGRLREETDELAQRVQQRANAQIAINPPPLPRWHELIANEAADVANFAMMVADVCGGLPDSAVRSIAEATTPPAPEAEKLRVAVEAIRAEINAPLTGPTHGAWDRGRVAGLKEALAALQAEHKGGA